MKGLLGRKVGMTQVFTEDGVLIPVTVVEATPNIVLQKKTIENDGYVAIQLGLEDVKETRATKAAIGHAKKVNTAPKRYIREIRSEEMMSYELGAEVKVDIFAAGEMVDVIGTSKGHGFTGAVVRHNQKIGPKTHGSGHHRGMGSAATTGLGTNKIDPGFTMPGHWGTDRTTNQNLEVIKVDAEKNYILIKGNVPGPRKGLVMIQSAKCSKGDVEAKVLVDYTKNEEE